MNNQQLLGIIKESFYTFLRTHSRSNEKLVVLHGAIAFDLANRIGPVYTVKSLGYQDSKEGTIIGRYMEKKVDITVTKGDQDVCGVAVKFVMNNYSQNSNNYFENMLGETSNIRANNIHYFQIVILPKVLPYYDSDGVIQKWETITEHNISKYVNLSLEDPSIQHHVPDRTLIIMIDMQAPILGYIVTKDLYKNHYLQIEEQLAIRYSNSLNTEFGDSLIFNNYDLFIDSICRCILDQRPA